MNDLTPRLALCLGLLAACGGSSNGPSTVNNPRATQTPANFRGPRVALQRASASDEAPALSALVRRGGSMTVASARPAPASVPAGSGYIVRSAGGPSAPGDPSGGAAFGTRRPVGVTEGTIAVAPATPMPMAGAAAPAATNGLSATGAPRGHMARAEAAARPRSIARNTDDSASPMRRPSSRAGFGGGSGAGRDGDGVAADMVAPAPAGGMAAPQAMAVRGRGGSTGGYAQAPVSAGMVYQPPADPSPVMVAPMPMPPPPPPEEETQAQAGLLTAGSVGDCDRRGNYLEYVMRHDEERAVLDLDLTRRVRFRVLDAVGRPQGAVPVVVHVPGSQDVQGMTHGDGVWDFFPSFDAPHAQGNVLVTATLDAIHVSATVPLGAGDGQGDVVLHLPAAVEPAPLALDLGFAIDVTGSMEDELRYLNREVQSIVRRIEAQSQGSIRVRVGATFYRDRSDDIVVQHIPFTTNVAGFAQAMTGVTAYGGGDYPEDMNAGLDAALNRMTWSEGSAVRVLVVIADAPPQPYTDVNFTWRNAMTEASRRGIRLLPVAASGSDRTVEYLFRAMGSYTSTPYVYLTDDSGVGGSHMEADTDRVAVERFNELLVRMVLADLHGDGMHEPGILGPHPGQQ